MSLHARLSGSRRDLGEQAARDLAGEPVRRKLLRGAQATRQTRWRRSGSSTRRRTAAARALRNAA
jgi:hypothetical protein